MKENLFLQPSVSSIEEMHRRETPNTFVSSFTLQPPAPVPDPLLCPKQMSGTLYGKVTGGQRRRVVSGGKIQHSQQQFLHYKRSTCHNKSEVVDGF